jgi:hypothetical protein
MAHLESYLGPIQGGWRDDHDPDSGLQVARFPDDTPFPGVTTLVTVGLSHHHLPVPDDKGVHQELLMHLPVALGDLGPSLLDLARDLLRRRRGLSRGEVIHLGEGFLGRGTLAALWAMGPVYLPEGFALCVTPAVTIVLIWLVPITAAEARLVATEGWRALEAAFIAENPDVTDLDRRSVTAARY